MRVCRHTCKIRVGWQVACGLAGWAGELRVGWRVMCGLASYVRAGELAGYVRGGVMRAASKRDARGEMLAGRRDACEQARCMRAGEMHAGRRDACRVMISGLVSYVQAGESMEGGLHAGWRVGDQ